jgi:hypothetical protein
MGRIGTIIAGALTTFIILAIMMGDIGSAALVYFASIICTLGISLVLWLPVWYGVGWIVIKIAKITAAFYLGLEKDKGATSAGAPPPQTSKLQALTERLNQELQNDPALARNQLALVNYIKKAKKKGIPNYQITLNLTNNGWTMESINAAYQMVHSLK